MADEVMGNYQHVIEDFQFISGTKGVFDFRVNGELLYSKKETGRHAEPGEIQALFEEQLGSDITPYPRN